jgi:hypothetical protein
VLVEVAALGGGGGGGGACRTLTVVESIMDSLASPLLHTLQVHWVRLEESDVGAAGATRGWAPPLDLRTVPFALHTDALPVAATTVGDKSSAAATGWAAEWAADWATLGALPRAQRVGRVLELELPLSAACFDGRFGRFAKLRDAFWAATGEVAAAASGTGAAASGAAAALLAGEWRVQVSYEVSPALVPMEWWPPDAARGQELPPAFARVATAGAGAGAIAGAGAGAHSAGVLLQAPLLDKSMPFNVILFNSMLWACVFGAVVNILTRPPRKKYDAVKRGPKAKPAGRFAWLRLHW